MTLSPARRFCLFAIFALLPPALHADEKELSLADLIERAEQSCVRIVVKFKDGSKGFGI